MDVQPITVPQSLAYVLNNAGDKSNVDFDYLLKTAMRESSLNPDAKAPSSSAVGLFQFLDTTWLQVMKEEGPRLGYQQYADAITKDTDGDYVVKDKKLRAEILKLREDPQVAADMAAAFTRVERRTICKPSSAACRARASSTSPTSSGRRAPRRCSTPGSRIPTRSPPSCFRQQAKANPQIFYDATATPGRSARSTRRSSPSTTLSRRRRCPRRPGVRHAAIGGDRRTAGGRRRHRSGRRGPSAITPKRYVVHGAVRDRTMPPAPTPLVGARSRRAAHRSEAAAAGGSPPRARRAHASRSRRIDAATADCRPRAARRSTVAGTGSAGSTAARRSAAQAPIAGCRRPTPPAAAVGSAYRPAPRLDCSGRNRHAARRGHRFRRPASRSHASNVAAASGRTARSSPSSCGSDGDGP